MNPGGQQEELFCSEYCYWVYKSTKNLREELPELPLPDDMLNLRIFKEGVKIFPAPRSKSKPA
jgi:hypothetical protein